MEELIAYAKWELVECMDSVSPSAELLGDPEDGFHAGCCALRAFGTLLRMERLLKRDGAKVPA
jgi:hypothetical protein